MTETKTKRRLAVLGVLILFMFSALTVRLWFLQVLAANDFSDRAETNRVRLVPDPPRRGRILDRDGEVLISNRQSTVLTVDRTQLGADDRERVVAKLSQLLDVDPVELGERFDNLRYYPYEPVPIAFDVSDSVATFVAEHDDEFPGLDVAVRGVREYPAKSLAAHLLGYTGEISEADMEKPRFEDYRHGSIVGKAGVELIYEELLQGKPGLVSYEVDARGEIQKRLGVQEPVAGSDLVLSIDKDLQLLAEDSLERGAALARTIPDDEGGGYLNAGAGAVVVMNPNNGQILAMASYPTFNPSDFIGGITQRQFNKLIADKANQPLINRAVSSSYPPGSIFKPFVAAAAVRAGVASLDGAWDCPAEYSFPGDTSGLVFRNWRDSDRGFMRLNEALIDSCDTVFYQFGTEFNDKRLTHGEIFQKRLRDFRLGSPTGIDLPSEFESRGRIPDVEYIIQKTDVEKHPNFLPPNRPCEEACWLPGDDINMSIGQGFVLTSPIQMAAAYSAIANGGTLYAPRLGLRVQAPDGTASRIPPRVMGRIGYSREVLDYIKNALLYVPRQGTAQGAFIGYPHSTFPIAGKTGTAEIRPKQPFSWFAAMSMVPDKPLVVVAIVEEGGHGSEVAAPIVRSIYEGFFGIERSELQYGGATD